LRSYVVERARRVLARHVERAFDGVRAHIVDSVWQAASPVQLAARSEALAVTRSQRQARFEQSLRQAPIGGEGDNVATSQFFATASGVDARQLRARLASARHVLVTRCFRPLRDALPWLEPDDIALIHERLADTLRLLVALLSADASSDSSGLATLAVLATLHYVRHEFAPDLFASFRTLFGAADEQRALPRALADAIRALEQALSRAFVRLHLAPIDSIVTDGMLRSGTNWFFHESRGMRVNDYVVKLLLRLVSTHNQLATRCPNLLDSILRASSTAPSRRSSPRCRRSSASTPPACCSSRSMSASFVSRSRATSRPARADSSTRSTVASRSPHAPSTPSHSWRPTSPCNRKHKRWQEHLHQHKFYSYAFDDVKNDFKIVFNLKFFLFKKFKI
jgi:hypothetical protein